MSLLQIAEPGMSTAPHEERFAVGIDLGTTNSLAATVRNGSPEVLVDEKNQKLLPSVVHYEKNGCVVVVKKPVHVQKQIRSTRSQVSSV